MSMRFKLNMAFGLIAVISVLSVSLVMYHYNAAEYRNNAFESNSQMAVAVSRQIDMLLLERINLLKAASDFPDIVSMDTDRQLPVMQSIAGKYKDMGSIIVADTNGQQTVRTIGTLASIADRDYFKEIKKGAPYVISEVLIAKGTGKSSLVLAVPIKNGQPMKGVLLGVLDLQEISDTVSAMKLKQNGYVFLTDRSGKVVTHPDKSLVQEQRQLADLEPVRRALAGETGSTQYILEGTEKVAGFSPVTLTGWATVVQIPATEVLAALNKSKNTIIIIMLLTCLLAIVVGHFLATSFIRPLNDLIDTAEALAEGDLTRQLAGTGKDEIGKLTASFIMMTNNLRRLTEQISRVSSEVLSGATTINTACRETTVAIEDISVISRQLADSAEKQQTEVNQISLAMNNVSSFMGEVSSQAKETNQFAQQAAAASKTGKAATDNAIAAMSDLNSEVQKTSSIVEQLGNRSVEIGTILGVISGIANQTNLLALNAAIEAARSGEQGRGFAVVAEEIRKLAEQSQSAACQIDEIVRQIQQDTGNAVEAMHSSLSMVNNGVEVVNQAGQLLQAIDESVAGSVGMAEEILTAVVQQENNIIQITHKVNELAHIAEANTENIQRVADDTQGASAAAQEVLVLAESLKQMAVTLTSAVEKFKQ